MGKSKERRLTDDEALQIWRRHSPGKIQRDHSKAWVRLHEWRMRYVFARQQGEDDIVRKMEKFLAKALVPVQVEQDNKTPLAKALLLRDSTGRPENIAGKQAIWDRYHLPEYQGWREKHPGKAGTIELERELIDKGLVTPQANEETRKKGSIVTQAIQRMKKAGIWDES